MSNYKFDKLRPGVFFLIAIFIGLFISIMAGCHPGVKEVPSKIDPLEKLKPSNYPLFMDNMDYKGLKESIERSLEYYKRIPLDREFTYEKDVYTAQHLIHSLETFQTYLDQDPSTKALNDFIKRQFIVYKAAGNDDKEVLFTGYFEPTYEGSLTKDETYAYPLYSKPNDLMTIDLALFSEKYKGHKKIIARVNDSTKKIIPYYSREQINDIEDFHEKSTPLVWLKSRVDRFFLEIQGSGRVTLENGEELRAHYAGSNGNPYSSVGRYLINKNEILKENMSMQAIRTWLEFHPNRVDEVLHYNKSFVFFQLEDDGPYGSLGVKVTPMRSIATDSKLFPKGGLCFMQAQLPDNHRINPIKEWENASFFVMNQDTGGAIKGAARADLFCGNSNYAEYTAGHMNKYGNLFFLVLKP